MSCFHGRPARQPGLLLLLLLLLVVVVVVEFPLLHRECLAQPGHRLYY